MTQKLISDKLLDSKGLTEEEYLLRYDPDRYPKPSVTADILIFNGDRILLIKRKNHPFISRWALPGGFAEKDEELIDTARRELEEETSLRKDDLALVGVFSKPGRDPRGWTVSAAYMSDLSDEDMEKVRASDDAKEAGWFRIEDTENGITVVDPESGETIGLAFDHLDIIREAVRKRRGWK